MTVTGYKPTRIAQHKTAMTSSTRNEQIKQALCGLKYQSSSVTVDLELTHRPVWCY